MSKVLSGLVQPVIRGQVDMAMVEYSDKVGLVIQLPVGNDAVSNGQ